MSTPVWLDCDPGHDDLLALMLAAFSPKLDLQGVSAVHGNASVEHTTQNAAKALVAFRAPSHLLVHQGRASPITRAQASFAAFIHGSDGLGGVEGLPPADHPAVQSRTASAVTSDATSAIRQSCLKALENGQKLTLLATGSLSNVAAFLVAHTALAREALSQVLFMGGCIDELGNSNPHRSAEWNVYADPEALDSVMEHCPCPIVFFPLDVTHKALFRDDIELARLKEKQTNQRLVIETAIAFFRDSYLRVFGFKSPPCHDVLTSAYAIQPDLFTVKEERLVLEKNHGEHRGRLSRAETGDTTARLCHVAYDVKVTEMWSLFFDALERSEAAPNQS